MSGPLGTATGVEPDRRQVGTSLARGVGDEGTRGLGAGTTSGGGATGVRGRKVGVTGEEGWQGRRQEYLRSFREERGLGG